MNQPAEFPAPPRPRRIPTPSVKPVITFLLIGITSAIYILQLTFGDAFTYAFGLKINDLIRQGEFWRLITPVFFHASPVHILFNMYSLYSIGPEVERAMGYARFLLIYFLSGFVGVLASFVFSPDYSLGASGAIFGLIGALAVFLYRHRHLLGAMGRNMLSNVLFIIVLNIFLSFTPGIDLWGHFGGLAMGSIVVWILGPVWKVETDPYIGEPHVIDSRPIGQQWLKVGILLLVLGFITFWLVSP
jgi:membrane associated rhomboid family serine protease